MACRQAHSIIGENIMKDNAIFQIARICSSLSIMAFGGGKSMIPDLHKEAVTDLKWMSEERFVDLFAISQTAPGPSTLFVSLIGYQAAGWTGFLVAALTLLLPEFILVYSISVTWDSIRKKPISHIITEGVAPVTIGLLFSGAIVVATSSVHGAGGAVVAIFAFFIFCLTKINPILVMAIAAIIGLMGWA